MVALGLGAVAQRGDGPAADGFLVLPQQAQPAALHQVQGGAAVVVFERVVPRPEENEMVVSDPGQEFPAFLEQFRRATGGPLVDHVHGFTGAARHGRPVFHHFVHVGHRRPKPAFHRLEDLGIVLPVDLQMDQRFRLALAFDGGVKALRPALGIPHHVDHGMHHQVHTDVQLRHHQDGRVHEERLVCVDQFHHRVLAGPSVPVPGGIEGADAYRVGRPPVREIHQAGDDRRQRRRALPGEFILRYAAQEGLREVSRVAGPGCAQAAGQDGPNLLQRGGRRFFGGVFGGRHGVGRPVSAVR